MSITDILQKCYTGNIDDPDAMQACLSSYNQNNCDDYNTYYGLLKDQLTPDQINDIKTRLINSSKSFNENTDTLVTSYILKTNCLVNALNNTFGLPDESKLKTISLPNVQTMHNNIVAMHTKENYDKGDVPKNIDSDSRLNYGIFFLLLSVVLFIIPYLGLRFPYIHLTDTQNKILSLFFLIIGIVFLVLYKLKSNKPVQ